MDLKKFILPTVLDNTDNDCCYENKEFETKDLIYLDSGDEVKSILGDERENSPTDYTIMTDVDMILHSGKFYAAMLRTSLGLNEDDGNSFGCTSYMLYDGEIEDFSVNSNDSGICPSMHLDISSIINEKSKSSNFGKIVAVKDLIDNVLYHTIEFGEFPKTYVGDKKNQELEKLYSLKKLVPTGKEYTGKFDVYDSVLIKGIDLNPEYEYQGEKYVRVLSRIHDDYFPVPYSDGTTAKDNESVWVKVEPIVWKIKNWDDLPKELNPNGSGKAKFIDVRTEQAIISGIPFYPDRYEDNCYLWQNSTIRGYLNGINVNNIKTNGNPRFSAPNGGDFSKGNSFLKEAFIINNSKISKSTYENSIVKGTAYSEPLVRKSRLDKLNPDMTPSNLIKNMTDTEIIKSWIDSGESVLLRGPSGIGKTERIKKLYPDLIYIKLTNNMFPEKVVGSMNLQTGDAIPPDFVKHALLSEATEDEKKLVSENIQNLFNVANEIYERSKNSDKKVVIMLDELLNVKPAVQSLVYTLVLNKFVEIGKGLKLPANTVIVATGNQKKYSIVAEDLAEPLEKRFDHILDMEPKVGEWLSEYAIPNNLHPAVVGYIFSKYLQNKKSESICDIGYFYEEPEVGETNLDKFGCKGKTNDPRGWASLSNSLCNFENNLKTGKYVGRNVENILKTTLYSKLRNEWAEDFFDFYNKPVLSPQDIVNNQYTETDFPTNINERFAQLAGLLTADESQVKECRKFIQEHCDPEYLSVYDIYWAGNDENKIQKIAELQEMDAISVSEDDVATTY